MSPDNLPAGGLEMPVAAPVASLADRADRIRQLRGIAGWAIWQVGRELIAASEVVDQGDWRRWLRDEFDWSHDTARNYMNVALAYEGRTIRPGSTTLTIDATALYALSAPGVPQEARDEALARAQEGERIAKADAEELIKRWKVRLANLELELRTAKAGLATLAQYGCIVIDPPWPMKKIERDVRPNQVEFDYPTMDEAELSSFPVKYMAAPDCHLFCWTTHRFLPMALGLLGQWGFKYVLTMVWNKVGGFQPVGLPQYNCEFVVYGRRGSPSFIDTKAFPTCFTGDRREHSRKPDEFYDLIRRVTDGPRIDVFSREPRDGFDQFGNEADKFLPAPEGGP